LPIEDPYLKAEPALKSAGAPSVLRSANPLLTAITFLAAAVDGNVALAGTKAAVTSLVSSTV
jgi:hypothetical protein